MQALALVAIPQTISRIIRFRNHLKVCLHSIKRKLTKREKIQKKNPAKCRKMAQEPQIVSLGSISYLIALRTVQAAKAQHA